jgi:hypothetical protein
LLRDFYTIGIDIFYKKFRQMKLDKKIGPWSIRVWGLVLNFFGNAVAIYGAIGFIHDGSRLPLLILGAVITLTCILVLARPSD